MTRRPKPRPPKPYHDTTVSVNKSRSDIANLLEKWGVQNTQWTTMGNTTTLRFQFEHEDRTYNARLAIDPKVQGTPFEARRRRQGSRAANEEYHWAAENRRLHRTLYWYVKSKIEAIDSGLETPTQAWLAAIEGPRGHTVYQELEQSLRTIEAGNLSTVPALPAAPEVVEAEVIPVKRGRRK